ncbi:hypothetical protein SVAN01_07435 [Stagonosporopsis vannaccii]|nr:hypothetical protein SVAN01_07435 [Stagonosporopsis vannaccii]
MPRHGFDGADRIDIGDLTDYINRELGPQEIYLSDSDIREALRELKNAAEGYGCFREEELVNTLRNKLDRDRGSGGAQGLYRSRTRFLVFCYTAARLGSHRIARALLRFFARESHEIVRDEIPLLTEWCIGLQQLQGLVDEDRLGRAFRQVASRGPPLFEEWQRPGADVFRSLHDGDMFHRDRARDRLQILGPRHRHVRHASVPVHRRENDLVDPPYPRPAYHFPLVGTRYELDGIHLHQQLHGLELHRLNLEVEDLHRHRW